MADLSIPGLLEALERRRRRLTGEEIDFPPDVLVEEPAEITFPPDVLPTAEERASGELTFPPDVLPSADERAEIAADDAHNELVGQLDEEEAVLDLPPDVLPTPGERLTQTLSGEAPQLGQPEFTPGAESLGLIEPDFSEPGAESLGLIEPDFAEPEAPSLAAQLSQKTGIPEEQLAALPEATLLEANRRLAGQEQARTQADAEAERKAQFEEGQAQAARDFANRKRALWAQASAQLDELGKAPVEEKANRLWASAGTPRKIGMALAIFFGGLAARSPGGNGKNTALAIIQRAIDQDIEAQRQTSANRKARAGLVRNNYQLAKDALGSDEAADAYAREQLYLAAQTKALQSIPQDDLEKRAEAQAVFGALAEEQRQRGVKAREEEAKLAELEYKRDAAPFKLQQEEAKAKLAGAKVLTERAKRAGARRQASEDELRASPEGSQVSFVNPEGVKETWDPDALADRAIYAPVGPGGKYVPVEAIKGKDKVTLRKKAQKINQFLQDYRPTRQQLSLAINQARNCGRTSQKIRENLGRFSDECGHLLKGNIEQLKANFILSISGAQASDREVVRLEKVLGGDFNYLSQDIIPILEQFRDYIDRKVKSDLGVRGVNYNVRGEFLVEDKFKKEAFDLEAMGLGHLVDTPQVSIQDINKAVIKEGQSGNTKGVFDLASSTLQRLDDNPEDNTRAIRRLATVHLREVTRALEGNKVLDEEARSQLAALKGGLQKALQRIKDNDPEVSITPKRVE